MDIAFYSAVVVISAACILFYWRLLRAEEAPLPARQVARDWEDEILPDLAPSTPI